MHHFQCLQCMKQHPYRQPDFCDCGNSSFTLIHSADAVLAPEGADAGGLNVGPDVAAGAGLVATGAAAPEAGDDVDGDAELVDVGGFECSQDGCDSSATHRFTWPGSGEKLACKHHAEMAERVAEAGGFEPINVEPL